MNIPSFTHGMYREDEEEMNIYANADPINRTETENSKRHQTPQHTEMASVKIRSSRAALVCLVLLCVLLLTAVIVLGVYIHTKSTNYTEEKKQLLTKITNIAGERDQLITKSIQLTKERDVLIKQREESKCLCENVGWTRYESSYYYVSSEVKSWTESRRYCTERGADLIIINNKEEQDFFKRISGGPAVWIGLTDSDEEGTWKWVDGSTLTSGFWDPREPNGDREENCALNYSPGWADYPCDDTHYWICMCTVK
ncbi:C-type lectin domain family 17, member A [Anabarilius grahami]|uniref:C-type lectin domain family 17, member A n=1 Tax=Anabarilius grahami TaxID=495550 RepID=A0A3N0XL24_ANAGA|nr:C-type lectin domain family 17, member A [Anabarilius grahami]